MQVTINMRLVKEGLGGGAILAGSGASRWAVHWVLGAVKATSPMAQSRVWMLRQAATTFRTPAAFFQTRLPSDGTAITPNVFSC